MGDEAVFPRWFYAAAVPEGRVFDDQAALDAARAEGPWYTTPTEAADAAASATAAPQTGEQDEPHTRRSHR